MVVACATATAEHLGVFADHAFEYFAKCQIRNLPPGCYGTIVAETYNTVIASEVTSHPYDQVLWLQWFPALS